MDPSRTQSDCNGKYCLMTSNIWLLFPGITDTSLDIMYAIDSSAFVSKDILDKLKDFVRYNLKAFNDLSKDAIVIELLHFGSTVQQLVDTEKKSSMFLVDSLLKNVIPIGGHRNIGNVFNYVKNKYSDRNDDSLNRKKILVVMTTGSTIPQDKLTMKRLVDSVLNLGVQIIVVSTDRSLEKSDFVDVNTLNAKKIKLIIVNGAMGLFQNFGAIEALIASLSSKLGIKLIVCVGFQ